MAFNVAKIASARASLTISLTKSLRVAGPLMAFRRLDASTAQSVSQFFVLPTCAVIALSFSYYYSINLKSVLLNLWDRHKSF